MMVALMVALMVVKMVVLLVEMMAGTKVVKMADYLDLKLVD